MNVEHLRRIVAEPDVSGTRYKLVEQIAQGGMGVIWSAIDTQLDRKVALKVLPVWDDPVGDTPAASLLLREAGVLAKLEHPGIVPIHDAGALPDGRVYYAMKLVQGGQLSDARVGASRGDLLRLFQRVIEPVAFAHSCGVIHRDLKPENVMVGAFGEVLVMDWGIAKLASVGAETGVIGTPAYMAPEQAAGQNDRVNERTDVYGLGGILRFLLDGQPVPRPLAAIVTTATAADPDARYSSAAAMSADIARFLDAEPVSVYRERWWEIVLRWTKRNHTLLLLLLAYLIMRGLTLFFLSR